MTSAEAPVRARPLRLRGFTLIELLVVIGIIVTLTALLAGGLMTARQKAQDKSSRALVQKVKTALESYFSEFRDYPPDGYDDEAPGAPGWVFDANQGVQVGYGTNARYMKGTALLMYYLCQPLVKISRTGSDPNDPRNIQRKRVGPFLTDISGEYFSMREVDGNCSQCGGAGTGGGFKETFSPTHPWNHGSYWSATGGLGFEDCEIVDAYGRPLCYDKVKVNDPKYFQPDRFQDPGGGAGKGHNAHTDRKLMDGGLDLIIDQEPDEYDSLDGNFTTLRSYRMDPRFADAAAVEALLLNGNAPGAGSLGTSGANALQPANVGGYNLWSAGRSWIDPRDDICSWKE